MGMANKPESRGQDSHEVGEHTEKVNKISVMSCQVKKIHPAGCDGTIPAQRRQGQADLHELEVNLVCIASF